MMVINSFKDLLCLSFKNKLYMHLWWRRGWKKREKFLNGVIWEPTA